MPIESTIATLQAGGWLVSTVAVDISVGALVGGGDHPYLQWYGTNGRDGMAAMYLDRGIKPYCAINTGDSNAPGQSNMMSWAQCVELQTKGVEFVSHGVWHVNSWTRINTGLLIKYVGANGTGTVQVTSTQVLGVAGGADDFTVTLSVSTTLAAVKAVIEATNGGNKWTCVLSPELVGTEPSSVLLTMAAARDAKTSGNNQRFAAGGGIEVTYAPSSPPAAYKHVYMRRNASGNFNIFGDGVQLFSQALAAITLTTLVTNINAIAGGEFSAKLCDNGRTESASQPSYVNGDEQATNIKEVTYVEFGSRPQVMDAGLSQWEMIDRQFQGSKDTAAANGITLKHFAQSGGDFYPWLVAGHTQYGLHRGNQLYSSNTPPAQRLALVKDFVKHRTMTDPTAQPTAGAFGLTHMRAIVSALADGPNVGKSGTAFVFCMLMHKLLGNVGTYQLPTNDSNAYYDQTESNWLSVLDLIKTSIAAGSLKTYTFDQLWQLQQTNRPAQNGNLFFNPRLINAGNALTFGSLGAGNGGYEVPGWGLILSATTTGISIDSDRAYNVANSSATAIELLNQEIELEPGKSYEFTAHLDTTAFTSGLLGWSLNAMRQRMKGLYLPGTNFKLTGAAIFQRGVVSFRVTIPKFENFTPPELISKNVEPYNLAVNNAIKLNILSILSMDNLNCSTGAVSAAAVTAKEAAAAINAVIVTNAASYPAEFHTVARAVAGKVVLTAPYINTDQNSAISVLPATTLDASSTIFGATTNDGRAQFLNPPTSENFIWRLALRSTLIATFRIRGLSCREIQYS